MRISLILACGYATVCVLCGIGNIGGLGQISHLTSVVFSQTSHCGPLPLLINLSTLLSGGVYWPILTGKVAPGLITMIPLMQFSLTLRDCIRYFVGYAHQNLKV